MSKGSIVWVRSLLAVYRQAAVDASRDGVEPAARQQILDVLGQVQTHLAQYEELDVLWQSGFGGSEDGVRTALAPMVEGALSCDPSSPMRALVEFAAEEIGFLFEDEEAH